MKASHVLCCALLALSVIAATARIDSNVVSSEEPRNAEPTKGETGLWCKTCNVFVTVFDKVLMMQQVIDFLDKYFEDHVCHSMPPALVEECMKDVPKVIPAIIRFLESLASSSLCSTLGVCEKSDLRTIAFHEKQMRMNQASNDDMELCDVCHKFTGALEEKVDVLDPSDVMKWKDQLEQTCLQVPEDMREKCKSLVDRYSYLMMYYLVKEKDEGDISKACADLGVCSSAGPTDVPPFQLALVKKMAGVWIGVNEQDNCKKCMEVAKRAEGAVAEPDFEDEFGAYITRVCKYVPPIKEKCTESLKSFSNKFLDSLLKIIAPEAVCTRFGFCGEGDVPDDVQMALDMDFGFNQEIKYVH
ncbi:hypothetical protein BSKO_12284 [Bryopsis sp. KO-2023]|nr:hypothetical protein BSKO_12284 [Bryopsis sp. KO-2023]